MLSEVLPEVFLSKAVIRTLPLVIDATAITEDYNQEFKKKVLRKIKKAYQDKFSWFRTWFVNEWQPDKIIT